MKAPISTLKEVRSQHVPTYSRKRLGLGAISGRQLWATRVQCSCGWTCTINQPKAEAERDWKSHTREVWEQLRHPATAQVDPGGEPLGASHEGDPSSELPEVSSQDSDPAWKDYLRWQERQKAVLACPCCAAKALWRQADRSRQRLDSVQCTDCGLLMQGTYDTGSAVSKWNTRA